MFKYWSEFLDVIWILLDNIYFLNYSCVLSVLIPVLSVVLAATYCGASDSTNIPGEE